VRRYTDSYTLIDSKTAPTRFRIWKAGENMTDHGPIYFTAKSAALLKARQEERKTLYSIDYDHLSLSENRPAEAGQASGWHKLDFPLDANGEPELWATDVEWCQGAKEGIEARPPKWRYISPAYFTDKEGQIIEYVNLALCINPATHDGTSLASRTQFVKNKDAAMDIESILAMLKALSMTEGLGDEAKAKIAEIMAALEKAPASTPAPAAAKADEAAPAPATEAPKPEEKKDSFDLANRLAAAESQLHSMEMEKLFADNLGKKLTPGQKQWFVSLSKDTATAFLKSAPALSTEVPVKRADTVGDTTPQDPPGDEKHIDMVLGLRKAGDKTGMDTTTNSIGRYEVHMLTPSEIRARKAGK